MFAKNAKDEDEWWHYYIIKEGFATFILNCEYRNVEISTEMTNNSL
jgi:hypothetical protein